MGIILKILMVQKKLILAFEYYLSYNRKCIIRGCPERDNGTMLLNKKRILILYMVLMVGILCTFCGCSIEDTPSLEEVLQNKEEEDFRGSEWVTDDEAAGGNSTEDILEDQIYVYVCGYVHEPGVYMLAEGSRIVAAIEAAGGFLEEAARDVVNLAAPVTDGMQIIVPSQEDVLNTKASEQKKQEGKVELNTAGVEELCKLSGIGASKAEAILAYRNEIGKFTTIEQIKNVTGIGDSLFAQIKESIYIE